MVSLLIALLLTITTPTTTGDVNTTNTKDPKKPGTSNTIPGGVDTNGGSGTWAEGTHRK